jgi:selenocysteine-specific elongation factor
MRHLIIGTAGHVDHGKTALIKALTQIDCDTHKEEKERGITINLGFAHTSLPSGETIGIVDVPGHKDFIKTMVAGAFGVDIALLVVAANSGIMPQTVEHLQIIELLGINNGIVVITKKDLADDEMLELAQLEVDEFLQGSILENAPIVSVSSTTGEGIDKLISEISNLIPKLKNKTNTELFRMYVDRVFNVVGVGFVVTGSVLGGRIETGKNLYLLPGKVKNLRVRNIERYGISVSDVVTGDRAAINLSGFKNEDFERGMVLSDKIIEETFLIDTTLQLFADNYELGIWSKVIFYSGTFECAAKMHLLNKDILKSGEKAIIQIHLEKPAILVNKDRFIIRNSSNDTTLGGGIILDVKPLHHRRRTPKLGKAINELLDVTLNSDKQFNIIKFELKKRRLPLMAEQLAEVIEMEPDKVLTECLENNDGTVKIYKVSGKNILINTDLQNDFIEVILNALKEYHSNNLLIDEGMEANEFSGKFNFKLNEAGKMYISALLASLEKDKIIKKVGDTWALYEHFVRINDKTLKQLKWLEDTLKKYNKQTPLIKEVESKAFSEKINKENLKMLLKYLVNNGKLKLTEGEYIHLDIVNEVKKQLLFELNKKEKGINEKEFRLLIDSTKIFVKTAIRIFVEEGIITKSEFYIHITEKGKGLIN